MNKLIKIGIGIVAVVVGLSMAKNLIFQWAFEGVVSKAAHVPVKTGSTDLNLGSGSITLKNLRVMNPRKYTERLMLDAPLVAIEADIQSFFKNQAHFKNIEIDLKELTVIRSRDGRLNVDAVKPEKKPGAPAEKSSGPKLHIDRLSLSIGRVVYKDYSLGDSPTVQTFEVGIRDRVFNDLESPDAVVSVVMFEALTHTALANLADLDLGAFKGNAADVLSKGLNLSEKGADAVQTAARSLSSLFK